MDDVLDTGETQPRLPDAGDVRDLDIPQPTFDAPFALTMEVGRVKAVTPGLFDRPEDR